jgi:hypothetical protein
MNMATGKYEHLIKPLSIGEMDWGKNGQGQPGASVVGPGNAKKEIWLNGRDHLEGLNFNFSWGVHNTLGDWHAGLKPHTHSYPECLFFVGLDTANVNYLGAEIEFCLGDEQETCTFNDPTAIVIPAGLPHGPITTTRVFSPRGFGFFSVALNATFDINWLEKKNQDAGPIPSTGKYAHLIKSLKSGVIVERGKLNSSKLRPAQIPQSEEMQKKTEYMLGPGIADHLTWMQGKDLEGLNVNVAWGFSSQPGIWHRGIESHTHSADEVLILMGTDPNNADYLGAEIEIDLGKEEDRYIISKPSAIVCPADLPYAPIVTRWVDKSFALILINLAGDAARPFE